MLVKFPGSDDAPGTQRWSDLLVCEHLASQVPPEHLGLREVTTRLYRFGARTFLEIERFDRHGAAGRSGVASWASLNGALFGLAAAPWTEAAHRLAARAWLPGLDAEQTALLWHFGQFIGNTDMHDGNLFLQPQVLDGKPVLQLAPAYDMLPMLYAPARGLELPHREFKPRPLLPSERDHRGRAAAAAAAFWQLAARDPRISAAFRSICAANAQAVERLR